MKTDAKNTDRNLLALIDFGRQINSKLDLEFILNNLLFTIFAKLMITKGAVFLKDDNDKLKRAIIKGVSRNKLDETPIFIDENGINEFSNKFGFPLKFEISFGEKSLGVLFLGERINKAQITESDEAFLKTVLSITATAIENSLNIQRLAESNRELKAKINQLNSLFDLAKEFTGIFEVEAATKTFLFSLIGQFLVSKYAVVSCDKKIGVIESKFDKEKLTGIIFGNDGACVNSALRLSEASEEFAVKLRELGVELLVPMQYKNETRALILLGKRADGKDYSQSDIEYIYSAGSLAMISYENSRLFEEYLEKQKIEKDMELTRNIQRNLLPKKIEGTKNFDIAAINIPARQVGGDYYDVIKLIGGKTLVVIADVSGKGMQAALLMSNIQAIIKTLTKFDYNLDEATNMLNDLIAENMTNGSFITMFWGILDDGGKKFTYVNAGHNPPLFLRNSEIKKLAEGGMILGVMPTMIPYKSASVELSSGDKILLFTDGITEAMNENNEEYGDERFEKLFAQIEYNDAEKIKEIVLEDVRNHVGNAEQSDDITLLSICVK